MWERDNNNTNRYHIASRICLPVNFIYQDIEYKFNDQYAKLDEELERFRNAIPVDILDMKIGDLKRMVGLDRDYIPQPALQFCITIPYPFPLQGFPTFAEVQNFLDAEKNLNSTVQLDMSVRDEGMLAFFYYMQLSVVLDSHFQTHSWALIN